MGGFVGGVASLICSTEYGMAAAMADTFVERVFGGQLASSVTCSQCNTVSHMTSCVCVSLLMVYSAP